MIENEIKRESVNAQCSPLRRWVAILMMITVAFGGGFLAGSIKRDRQETFHDMIVNDPDDVRDFIDLDDKRVRALADTLQTPENAYTYVRDRVVFDPAVPAVRAGDIIKQGRTSCMGKAILLCTLYRAMGIPASDVRVVTGELAYDGAIIDHAWVDMEYKGACLQQDPTDFIGKFSFEEFRGTSYVHSFVRREAFAFNDVDFVIISRLNQLKGRGHPPVQ